MADKMSTKVRVGSAALRLTCVVWLVVGCTENEMDRKLQINQISKIDERTFLFEIVNETGFSKLSQAEKDVLSALSTKQSSGKSVDDYNVVINGIIRAENGSVAVGKIVNKGLVNPFLRPGCSLSDIQALLATHSVSQTKLVDTIASRSVNSFGRYLRSEWRLWVVVKGEPAPVVVRAFFDPEKEREFVGAFVWRGLEVKSKEPE